jgi:hypothetical protein
MQGQEEFAQVMGEMVGIIKEPGPIPYSEG